VRTKRLASLGVAILAAVACAASPAAASRLRATPAAATPVTSLSGAGSTLVAPLVAEWAQEFTVFFGVKIDYGSVGSQSGLTRLAGGSVDFAATDSPLTTTQLKNCSGCGQIPWALTAVGVGYHVSGAGNKLRLSPSVLAAIYLGQITKWNDRRITALNPGVHLPALKITPITSNASGDTYVFTQYLSRVSSAWRTKVGTGDTVSVPVGLTTNGNAGVTALLQSTNGAIGYVGASYLITHRLPAAAIQNAAGKYEYPNLPNITAAAATVKSVPANGALPIVNPPRTAATAYPISTFGYVVVSSSATAARRAALRDWISFAVGAGQQFGQGLDFAPLPSLVARADRRAVRTFATGT
jgi:phosphate transport system substrate-binding protein